MSVEETAGGPPAPRFLGSQTQMVLSQRSQAQQRETGNSRVEVQGNAFGEREAARDRIRLHLARAWAV